jgi:hypothetical protein
MCTDAEDGQGELMEIDKETPLAVDRRMFARSTSSIQVNMNNFNNLIYLIFV